MSIASELFVPESFLITSNMAAVSLLDLSCAMNSVRSGFVSTKDGGMF